MRNVVMRDGADDVQYQKGTKRRWTALGEEEQWLQSVDRCQIIVGVGI